MNPVSLENTYQYPQKRIIEITFSDGTAQSFDYQHLKKIPYFKNHPLDSFNLPGITKESFKLMISIFLDCRHILDLLDEKALTDPNTYLNFEILIISFFLEDASGALDLIKKQLSVLSYEFALTLLSNYQEMHLSSSDPFQPFYISTIETIITENMAIKSDREQDWLSNFKAAQKEILKNIRLCKMMKMAIKALSSDLNNPLNTFFSRSICFPVFCNEGSKEMIQILQSVVQEAESSNLCYLNIFFLNRPITDLTQISPSKTYQLSHIKAENEKMQIESDLAKRCWKIYKFQLLLNLQYQSGNMKLNCPKLFAHYNLIPSTDYKRELSHFVIQRNVKVHYDLVNPSSKYSDIHDLENQIRKKMNASLSNHPEKMFANEEMSFKVLEPIDMQEIHTKILYHPEDAKMDLIELWKWNDFEIEPKNFEIRALPINVKEDARCIEGVLMKFKKVLRFICKLDSLKPIILDNAIDPTPDATHAYLNQLYTNRNMSVDSKFNFFSSSRKG